MSINRYNRKKMNTGVENLFPPTRSSLLIGQLRSDEENLQGVTRSAMDGSLATPLSTSNGSILTTSHTHTLSENFRGWELEIKFRRIWPEDGERGAEFTSQPQIHQKGTFVFLTRSATKLRSNNWNYCVWFSTFPKLSQIFYLQIIHRSFFTCANFTKFEFY